MGFLKLRSEWVLLVAACLSRSTTQALDLEITNVKCDSRSIRANFDYMCNNDSICTFGETETLEGTLSYYGVVDEWGLGNDDVVYVTTDLELDFVATTSERNLFTNAQMPICSEDYITADNANQNGECPADGDYAFSTTLALPSTDSELLDWAASGWGGKITMSIYNDAEGSALLGRCELKIQTHVTGSMNSKNPFSSTPSARTTALAVIGSLLAFFALVVYCCCCRKKTPRRQTGRFAQAEEEDPKTFRRMSDNRTGDIMV